MTNVQQSVTNFIEQEVSIRRGLSRGLLNTRALARYIHSNLQLPCTIDAVISAIRRYEGEEEKKEDIKARYRLIASAKVSSRTRMASVLLKKNLDTRNAIVKLYGKLDYSKGEVLRILEVSQYIKIILDEDNLRFIDSLFEKKEIMKLDRRLGEISIIYSEEVIITPGVFAALAGELALSGVSIIDGVICGNEHIFIINEDDLMRSLQAMHRISKWGERTGHSTAGVVYS